MTTPPGSPMDPNPGHSMTNAEAVGALLGLTIAMIIQFPKTSVALAGLGAAFAAGRATA